MMFEFIAFIAVGAILWAYGIERLVEALREIRDELKRLK